MGGVRGNKQVVTGTKDQGLTGQLQGGMALHDKHPLVLDLVVKSRLGVIAADDALDDQVVVAQDLVECLAGSWARKSVE